MNSEALTVETAILKLNLVRISLLLYPAGHKEIQKNLAVAHQHIRRIIAHHSSFLLELTDDTLMANKYVLNQENSVIREFAASLATHDIQTAFFKPGVKAFSLLDFIGRIAKKPDQENFNTPIAGIDIEIINYAGYALVSEPQGIPGKRQPSASSGASSRTSAGPPASGVSRSRDNAGKTTDAYSALINDLKEHAALEQDGTLSKSNKTKYLRTFLSKLNPALKEQLLSLARDHSMTKGSLDDLTQLLTSLDHYQVIKMLEKANREKQELSPSMLRMVQTVAATLESRDTEENSRPGSDVPPSEEALVSTPLKENARLLASKEDAGPLEPENAGDLCSTKDNIGLSSSEDLYNLFNREEYEAYIEQNYDTVLKKLMSTSQKYSHIPEGVNLDDLHNSLTRAPLERQFIRLILCLDTNSLDKDDFEYVVQHLVDHLLWLLSAKKITLLHRIHGKLRNLSRCHSDANIRDIAATGLSFFQRKSFVINALGLLDRSDTKTVKKIVCLLAAQDHSIVPQIINWCGRQPSLSNHRPVLELIARFKESAVSAIESSCGLTDPDFLKNMAVLLSVCPTRSSIACLETLTKSSHPAVKIQALKSMAFMGYKPALEALLNLLERPEHDLFIPAVQAVAELRLQQAAPELSRLLQSMPLSRTGLETCKVIVKALGYIGNKAVIPVIESILNRPWSFHPQRLTELKKAIYESLDGYGPDVRHHLLSRGFAEKNTRIKNFCAGLLEQTRILPS